MAHRTASGRAATLRLHGAHEIANTLAEFEEVTYVSFTTGEFDILMVAALRSQEELFNFLTVKLGRIEGIRRIRTNQVLKAVKRTFRYDRILRSEEENRAKATANG